MTGTFLAVVGSANLDIVVSVDHHPVTGETILGGDHLLAPGGKGANQAVAAARLASRVAFVGCIGRDSAGETLRESLLAASVDIEGLGISDDRPSGIALITVDPSGDNAIVVSPGANSALSPTDIENSAAMLRKASATLIQLEISIDAATAAAKLSGGMVVLDPAPAPDTSLVQELLGNVDVIVPNETELIGLADSSGGIESIGDVDAVVDLARSLPVETVVVTLGARGAVAVAPGVVELIAAPTVEPVDTTAAGDAFRAALTIELMSGSGLVEACSFAVRAGAAATLTAGAQPSLPNRTQIESMLTP